MFPVVHESRKQARDYAADLFHSVDPDYKVPDAPTYTSENFATGLRNRELPDVVTPSFNRVVITTVERHTEDSANRVLQDASEDDPLLDGWARVHLGPGAPCSFCRMLISRGPVYEKETAGFAAHDHCKCIPYPVKNRDHWDGMSTAKAYYREYLEATKGFKGADALNAYRRYVYDSDNPRGQYGKQREEKKNPESKSFKTRRAELETELAAAKRQAEVNDNLPDTPYRKRMAKVFRERIAELEKKIKQS